MKKDKYLVIMECKTGEKDERKCKTYNEAVSLFNKMVLNVKKEIDKLFEDDLVIYFDECCNMDDLFEVELYLESYDPEPIDSSYVVILKEVV